MPRFRSLLQPRLILQLAVLILAILCSTGCINKAATDDKNLPEEELYVDAKLGFNILHPLTWTKIRIPVASPEYRADLLHWKIPEQNNNSKMQIRVLPHVASAEELAEQLRQEVSEQPSAAEKAVVPYPHPLGEAVTTTSVKGEWTQRHFAIQGQQHTYIISFSVTNESEGTLRALFERIVSTLREL